MSKLTFNQGRYKWLQYVAADNKLSAGTLAVAIILFRNFNSDRGYAWPSVATIMAETNRGRATVFRAITQLEGRGWITRDSGRRGRRTNRYRMAFGNMD